MRVIIAGSRHINLPDVLSQAIIASEFKITEVVCGGCSGVDTMGACWADQNGIPVKTMPANWNFYGKSAGPRRNRDMAQYAATDVSNGGLIAIWDGVSRGTKNMIDLGYEFRLNVYIHRYIV